MLASAKKHPIPTPCYKTPCSYWITRLFIRYVSDNWLLVQWLALVYIFGTKLTMSDTLYKILIKSLTCMWGFFSLNDKYEFFVMPSNNVQWQTKRFLTYYNQQNEEMCSRNRRKTIQRILIETHMLYSSSIVNPM